MGRRPASRTGDAPRREGLDGPRPLERTFSPKEADVIRDDGRCAGEEIGPRPFLGRRLCAEGPTTHRLGVPRPAV